MRSTAVAVILLSTWAASAAHAAAPAPKSCVDPACHGALVKRAHVHEPVAGGECAECHRATGAAHPAPGARGFEPVAGGAALCRTCHDDPAADRGTIHDPVREGECVVCHDPHASAQPRLLKQPVKTLCFGCHEEASFALHAVRGVTLGSGHPLSGPRDPARKGEPFSCTSCHDPHATQTPRLWRFGARSTFDLCQNCHAY